ncbi:hypothetical protein AB833_04710 [Chromatiales bacterium (ex Bugula neritina AB1)]|nr:hypothetical protein AB833_04710 [Chromatiales bacterium (ex Bugula neritina AB1)]
MRFSATIDILLSTIIRPRCLNGQIAIDTQVINENRSPWLKWPLLTLNAPPINTTPTWLNDKNTLSAQKQAMIFVESIRNNAGMTYVSINHDLLISTRLDVRKVRTVSISALQRGTRSPAFSLLKNLAATGRLW